MWNLERYAIKFSYWIKNLGRFDNHMQRDKNGYDFIKFQMYR